MKPLPVIDIVRRSYLDLAQHREDFVRIGLPWLLVPFGLDFLASLFLGEQAAASVGLLSLVISLVGLGAIAVAWHRHILVGAPLAGPYAPVDGTVLRYVGLGFVVSLVSSVPTGIGLLLVMGLGGVVGAGASAAPVLVPIALLVAVILFVRLQLAFPGTAVGDAKMGLAQSWAATRGHAFRLLLGLVGTVVPVILAVVLAILASRLFVLIGAPRFGAFVALLANHGGSWLQTPLVAAFLSYSYLWLGRGGGGLVSAAPGST